MILRKIGIQIVRRISSKQGPEPQFSKSAAFMGKNRIIGGSTVKLDYYTTDEFANKKLLSALGSLLALVTYFGYIRESSDLDEILNTPPHILTANLERKMLNNQIKDAESRGQSTEFLRAQLEYVDVKEAALKVQFQEKNKKVGSV